MVILRRGVIAKKLRASGGESTDLRSLYAMLFKSCGILPDAAGKQSPFVLFRMLDSLSSSDEDDRSLMSGHLKMFYGQ